MRKVICGQNERRRRALSRKGAIIDFCRFGPTVYAQFPLGVISRRNSPLNFSYRLSVTDWPSEYYVFASVQCNCVAIGGKRAFQAGNLFFLQPELDLRLFINWKTHLLNSIRFHCDVFLKYGSLVRLLPFFFTQNVWRVLDWVLEKVLLPRYHRGWVVARNIWKS